MYFIFKKFQFIYANNEAKHKNFYIVNNYQKLFQAQMIMRFD